VSIFSLEIPLNQLKWLITSLSYISFVKLTNIGIMTNAEVLKISVNTAFQL
jgi:hypothetical protein